MAQKTTDTPFTTIIEAGRQRGFVRTEDARAWYRSRGSRIRRNQKGTRPPQLIREAAKRKRLQANLKKKLMIGNMYMFRYEPKLKESLPYYDRFPIVFPIEPYSDGFLGLNFHYLYPK